MPEPRITVTKENFEAKVAEIMAVITEHKATVGAYVRAVLSQHIKSETEAPKSFHDQLYGAPERITATPRDTAYTLISSEKQRSGTSGLTGLSTANEMARRYLNAIDEQIAIATGIGLK